MALPFNYSRTGSVYPIEIESPISKTRGSPGTSATSSNEASCVAGGTSGSAPRANGIELKTKARSISDRITTDFMIKGMTQTKLGIDHAPIMDFAALTDEKDAARDEPVATSSCFAVLPA